MNPFDWRGPEFLLFYIVFALIVFAVTTAIRKRMERSMLGEVDPQRIVADPYLIACLRGGVPEAMRIATVSLVDRGLLTVTGSRMKRREGVHSEYAYAKLENRIIEKYESADEGSKIFTDSNILAAAGEYETKLKDLGLLPNKSVDAARRSLYIGMVSVLVLVSAIKIIVAIARGRTNIAFLVILTVVAAVMLKGIAFPRLTVRGRDMINDLQRLYAGLRERSRSIKGNGKTTEVSMLGAVYGVNTIPVSAAPYTNDLFPQATSSSSSSCGSSGSSCGGGSSCGSSCGGGGCGGGCGGCGS